MKAAKYKVPDSHRAFTLVELLIVVAIIGIVLTMGVPFMRNAIDTPKGMGGALRVVQDACKDARAMAILQQTTTELIIRPGDGSFDITISSNTRGEGVSHEGGRQSGAGFDGKSTYPVKLPDNVHIEGLGVNGEDWTEDPEARVRFRSNGTCDEMSIVLVDDRNERRNIWLEVTTGLPEVESDIYKFKAR